MGAEPHVSVHDQRLYSVYRDDGAPLQNWTATPAIQQGIAWNEVRVVAIASSLSFYINEVLVWSGSDAGLVSGRVRIGMYRGPGMTSWLLVDYSTLTDPD